MKKKSPKIESIKIKHLADVVKTAVSYALVEDHQV
jgi:hypothetical protein